MEEEIKQLLSLRLKTLKAKYRSRIWVLAIVALLHPIRQTGDLFG
jgi:hypothetical protein